MKKLLTRKPATTSTSTKQETHTQEIKPENKNYPATTSTIPSNSARSEEETLQCKLTEIQKKTGNKFALNEIKREYELTGKDEKKTLINLLKQKEEEEATTKRNLFKRIEEANNVKALTNITFKEKNKSYLMEVLENVHGGTSQKQSNKIITLYHPKLQGIRENFAQPSPDQLIHINRND